MEIKRQKRSRRGINMGRKNIYDKDRSYDLLRYYVDWCTRHSYNAIEVRGRENIPTDGAVIIAPNHCNTLMDALVVLQTFRNETVFGARADMFKVKLIADIMYFLRILPMVRQRDGLRNVLKNYETQETIIETLEHGVRFCMFPEGRHRPAHSLLPLGKGVFRAAFAANARFGSEKPVYIVPTGLEYGDYFRYRSTCLVNFGKPVNVTELVKSLDVENEAQMMEPVKRELQTRMSELRTFIPDGEEYASRWALTRMLVRDDARQGTLLDRMKHNRHVISCIEEAAISSPEKMDAILKEAASFEEKRKKSRLSIWSFGKRNTVANVLGKTLIALLGIPYFLFSAVICLPMWLTFELLRGKLKDRAFHNTAGFGIKLGMGPLVFTGWTIAAFCLVPWPAALLFSLLTIPSYGFFYDYTEFIRIWISDIRLLGNRKLSKMYNDIIKEFENI